MFISAFSTRGSKWAGSSATLLLLFGLPLVGSVVDDEPLQTGLFYSVALLVGCGLGWLAGDAFGNSTTLGKIEVAGGVVAVLLLGLALPAYKIFQEVGQLEFGLLVFRLFGLPLQSGSVTGAVSYGIVAFFLVALISALVVPGHPDLLPNREDPVRRVHDTERRYNAMIAWGTVGSACGTAVAVLALGFGVVQLTLAESRWQKEVAIKAVGDESIDKPYISRHCLGALNKFSDAQVLQVSKRDSVKLSAEQEKYVRRCFADQAEADRMKLHVDEDKGDVRLTAMGSALLAQRVNYTLGKDGLVASLLKYKIADKAIITSELKVRLCSHDKPLVERLSKIELPGYPGTHIYDKDDSLFWLVTSNFCKLKTEK